MPVPLQASAVKPVVCSSIHRPISSRPSLLNGFCIWVEIASIGGTVNSSLLANRFLMAVLVFGEGKCGKPPDNYDLPVATGKGNVNHSPGLKLDREESRK